MKPLNKKARNKAFFKVVGLSVLSCIIVLIMGFTVLSDSFMTENKSKNSLTEYQKLNDFHKNTFEPGINEVIPLIDTLPVLIEQDEDIVAVDNDIANKIVTIQDAVSNEESIANKDDELNYQKFYLDITKVYDDLRKAYKENGELARSYKELQASSGNVSEAIALKDGIIKQKDSEIEGLKAQVQAGGSNAQLIKNLNDSLAKYKSDLTFIERENEILKSDIERLKK